MKLFKFLFILFIFAAALTACDSKPSSTITIGIIEPLQHKAMDEIVAGFSETLHALYHQPVTIKVENAQNDVNLERAIIEKMHDANYSMIVPIGVGATEMTLANIHDKPIVSIASDISDEERKKLQPCNVVAVHDEIGPKQLIEFIHAVYPNITELTLIHSSADKVFPEVQETINAGKEYGITVNHTMVTSLPELVSATQALPENTQGIFIIKDSLIVSGISTLQKAAANLHIPLITSDEGSVQDGAGFALGVHERESGVEGAKLAAEVLKGKSVCDLPITGMKNLTVFINQTALIQEGQSVAPVNNAAKQFGYTTEMVDKS